MLQQLLRLEHPLLGERQRLGAAGLADIALLLQCVEHLGFEILIVA